MAEEHNGLNAEGGARQSQPKDERPADAQAAVAQPIDTQPTVELHADEPKPDYSAAAGERTVVSAAPTTDDGGSANTTPLYRPAPEYGAYGPAPTAPNQQGAANGAPTMQTPLSSGHQAGRPGQQQGSRNPYETGNGNPFANPNRGMFDAGPAAGMPQNGGANGTGNPFGAPQQGAANGHNGQGGWPGAPAQPGQPKAPGKMAVSVATGVVAALVSAALCLGVGYAAITNGWVSVPSSNSLSNISSNKSGSGTAKAESGDAVDWASVASKVSSAVVSIQVATSEGTAAGSGAILDTDGHIVTNNHVISGAQTIQVTLADGTIYSAKVVGADTTTDLAVIQLQDAPSDLTNVEFADSDNLAVGESVMAIGNPLGYDDTATVGIVSALNRPVTVTDDNNNEIVTNAVQLDAAINPGNSGGPTFNAAGQVIGINSSIASTASSSSTAGSIGIGFAIPSNLVKRVADEIIKDGSVKHVALGVTITSATVEADGVTRGGAQIVTPSTGGSAVVSGGPADEAGLKVNDTIVAFNGNAVNNNYSLLGFVRAAALGDKVTLTIVRDGKTMDVDVTLDQEESSVNGSSSSNDNSDQGNGNGQNGGSDGNGQNDNGWDGWDGGGLSDPFGMW